MPKSRREPVSLTDFKVRALRPDPTGAEYIQGDREVGGLGVRVRPTGSASYVLMKRLPGQSKLVRVTLGKVGEISLQQAREQAREAVSSIKSGINLNRVRRDERLRVREAIARGGYPPQSLGDVAQRYLATEAQQLVRRAETEAIVRRHLMPVWAYRPIADLRQRDLWGDVLDAIVAKGHAQMARRVRKIAVRLLNFAIERGEIDVNHFASGSRGRRAGGLLQPSPPRERVLSDDEIRAVWSACDGADQPYHAFIKLSLLLGQRRSETAGMEWSEVDLENPGGPLWVIPGPRMKGGGKTHIVPLPPAAVAIIDALPKVCDRFVLASRPGRQMANFARAKRRLDAASGTSGWTVHDLRRTCRSGLSAAKVDSDTAERILAHAIPGIRAVYDRYSFLDEKRAGLERWATRLQGIIDPPPDNVVTLSAAR